MRAELSRGDGSVCAPDRGRGHIRRPGVIDHRLIFHFMSKLKTLTFGRVGADFATTTFLGFLRRRSSGRYLLAVVGVVVGVIFGTIWVCFRSRGCRSTSLAKLMWVLGFVAFAFIFPGGSDVNGDGGRLLGVALHAAWSATRDEWWVHWVGASVSCLRPPCPSTNSVLPGCQSEPARRSLWTRWPRRTTSSPRLVLALPTKIKQVDRSAG